MPWRSFTLSLYHAGSHAINPSFHMEILHGGISNVEKQFRVKYFNHGARNWGATALVEAEGNETAVAELPMWTTDQIIGHRKIALMKIDCEGCELDALLRYDLDAPLPSYTMRGGDASAIENDIL